MKTKIIATLIAALFCSMAVSAQVVEKYERNHEQLTYNREQLTENEEQLTGDDEPAIVRTITVNGLQVNAPCTQAQMIEAFGQPDKTEKDEDGGLMIDYGNCGFNLREGRFYAFDFLDNRFKINGIVGVGDPVSKIADLQLFRLKKHNYDNYPADYYQGFITSYVEDRSAVNFKVVDGAIVRIFYVYSDDL